MAQIPFNYQGPVSENRALEEARASLLPGNPLSWKAREDGPDQFHEATGEATGKRKRVIRVKAKLSYALF